MFSQFIECFIMLYVSDGCVFLFYFFNIFQMVDVLNLLVDSHTQGALMLTTLPVNAETTAQRPLLIDV